jgi:hypothetical protein
MGYILAMQNFRAMTIQNIRDRVWRVKCVWRSSPGGIQWAGESGPFHNTTDERKVCEAIYWAEYEKDYILQNDSVVAFFGPKGEENAVLFLMLFS